MARTNSRLQEELKQTKPFRSVFQEAVLSVMKTADVLERSIASKLESSGITGQQYNVLRILRGAGPEGLPTLAIGERLIEETPGVTRLLDRLERKALVRRKRCPHDRRQVLCYLTKDGERLLEGLDPLMNSMDEFIGGALSESEAENLVQTLEKIREAYDRQ